MSEAVSPRSMVVNNTSFFIEEDSTLIKVITCIPLIGIICTRFQETSLANKIKRTPEIHKLVKLIQVKNHYKLAAAIRNLFSAALVVSLIALGIFSGTFGTALASLYIGLAAVYVYRIHQNTRAINQLLTNGRSRISIPVY